MGWKEVEGDKEREKTVKRMWGRNRVRKGDGKRIRRDDRKLN